MCALSRRHGGAQAVRRSDDGLVEHAQRSRGRSASITSDLTGQALTRDESDHNHSAGDPHERWYRFNGNELGHVGNDGTWTRDYAGSVQTRGWAQSNGALGNNRRYGQGFSESIDQITSYEQGASGGGYTVRAGDTLTGIAAQVWGDASLWYKLAQANGLDANSALTAGQTLTLPAGVIRSTYNASQLRPYDPADAIGDVTPVSAQPTAKAKKSNKCGAFGKILLIAVAVAAYVGPALIGAASATTVTTTAAGMTIATTTAATGLTAALGSVGAGIAGGAIAGAAGSVVSQGLGLATGIQDKFSWKGVALAGIGDGVGGGNAGLGGAAQTAVAAGKSLNALARFAQTINGGGVFAAAARGLTANVAGQGTDPRRSGCSA